MKLFGFLKNRNKAVAPVAPATEEIKKEFSFSTASPQEIIEHLKNMPDLMSFLLEIGGRHSTYYTINTTIPSSFIENHTADLQAVVKAHYVNSYNATLNDSTKTPEQKENTIDWLGSEVSRFSKALEFRLKTITKNKIFSQNYKQQQEAAAATTAARVEGFKATDPARAFDSLFKPSITKDKQ